MTADSIFLINKQNEMVELSAQSYEDELDFQQLLVSYPTVLAGGEINPETPLRWLLVTREMGVPGEEGAGNRWSLDHLFLDQTGIPTLVEVKRSSDTRIRREVVGQTLDYAANAVVYWPPEETKRSLLRCERDGLSPEQELATLFEPEGIPEDFWGKVKTNLQAGRIRIVFVLMLSATDEKRLRLVDVGRRAPEWPPPS